MWRVLGSFALSVTLLTIAGPSWSSDPPNAVSRADAAARFAEGTKAFEAGDFRRAGEAFEAANRDAPNADALWNAARAWHRAGEAARAATLYARYLRIAPAEATDRGAATAQLAALSPKLARIEVYGDITDLKIDDTVAEDRISYVSRGAHVVSAMVGGSLARKDEQVEAGDVVSVVFEAPPPPSSVGPGPIAPPHDPSPMPIPVPANHDVVASSHRGWSPWAFAAGAALTSVAVGFTIASGIDTDNALQTFENNSTPGNLSSGQGKQLRTNILLGTSIALGVATAALGIWVVDWRF